MGLFGTVRHDEYELGKLICNAVSCRHNLFSRDAIKELEEFCEEHANQWRGSLLLAICYDLGLGGVYNPSRAEKWYTAVRRAVKRKDDEWVPVFLEYALEIPMNNFKRDLLGIPICARAERLRAIGRAVAIMNSATPDYFLDIIQWTNLFLAVPETVNARGYSTDDRESYDIEYTKAVILEVCALQSRRNDATITSVIVERVIEEAKEEDCDDYRAAIFGNLLLAEMSAFEDNPVFSFEIMAKEEEIDEVSCKAQVALTMLLVAVGAGCGALVDHFIASLLAVEDEKEGVAELFEAPYEYIMESARFATECVMRTTPEVGEEIYKEYYSGEDRERREFYRNAVDFAIREATGR